MSQYNHTLLLLSSLPVGRAPEHSLKDRNFKSVDKETDIPKMHHIKSYLCEIVFE